MSKEKLRKDTRDRKDTRGTKYTYYNGCFLILLLVKSRLGTFSLFKNLFNLFISMKTKDKTTHILKKGFKFIQNNNTFKKFLLILIISRFYHYLYVIYLILNIYVLFYLKNSIYN